MSSHLITQNESQTSHAPDCTSRSSPRRKKHPRQEAQQFVGAFGRQCKNASAPIPAAKMSWPPPPPPPWRCHLACLIPSHGHMDKQRAPAALVHTKKRYRTRVHIRNKSLTFLLSESSPRCPNFAIGFSTYCGTPPGWSHRGNSADLRR